MSPVRYDRLSDDSPEPEDFQGALDGRIPEQSPVFLEGGRRGAVEPGLPG